MGLDEVRLRGRGHKPCDRRPISFMLPRRFLGRPARRSFRGRLLRVGIPTAYDQRVCDIWMESSKPGSYAEWGLTDEVVLAGNPKLVIAHVSGYGQSGHPDYLGRASYDMVGHPPREGTHVPRVRRVWRRHPLGSLPLLRLWEEGEGLRRAQTTRLIAAVVGHESRPRSSVATKKACLTRPTPALLFVDYHLSEIRVRLLRSGG